VSFDRDQEAGQWQHVSLQVPWFSSEELPIKDPGPLSTFSVGEEISASLPTAIAWSEPGLAKYKRCALAVLTSNLVLSIWSADGKPQEESSWSRTLIVNDVLRAYFLGNNTAGPSHITSDRVEEIRLRTRIRTFAWAPAFSEFPCTLGTRTSYGQNIIAVSNDDNHLVFVAINSPTSTLGAKRSWTAEVLACFLLQPDPTAVFSDPAFFDDLMQQQRFISHVAWSPWITRGNSYCSVIAYATNGDVRTRPVTYSDKKLELGDEMIYPDIELRHNGPMRWCHAVTDDKFMLALFTSSGLVHAEVSPDDASFVDRSTHDLNGRWDQVSGAIWDCGQLSTPRLHFTSMQSTLQSSTATVEVSSGQLIDLPAPSWREQIRNSLILFSVKNDLKGNSRAKVWGLASSPLNDFIATCYSAHPSDMIEYGPPAERRGTVAISALRQSFPATSVSAEGVLFTLSKLVENTVEDAEQIPTFAKETAEKLFLAYGPSQDFDKSNDSSATSSDSTDLEVLLGNFKTTTFLEENTLRDRYAILVSYACNATSSNDLPKTLIAYRLASSIQKLSSDLSRLPFSAEVLAQHKEVVNLIRVITQADSDVDSTPENSMAVVGNGWTDTCDFCSAPIPLTDLTTAMCTNGHQFPRCGLSFLAIQAPGITKYCGICRTPYLSEEFVAAQEVENEKQVVGCNGAEETQEQLTSDVVRGRISDTEGGTDTRPVTLAKVLFLGCDVCIYCGGKFVA
jgi:hypothetical protein